MSVRVLLVDDHEVVRKGLRALLETKPDVEVVGEAEDGRTAVQLAVEQRPDVVVMDVALPDLNGPGATRQIVAQCPGVRVLALSMHADSRFVSEMLAAGASGYVLKTCKVDELVKAVSTVVAGQAYLSPEVAGPVVQGYVAHLSDNAESGTGVLSDREREVLQLLAEGKSTKQIASRLDVSVRTVDSHRQHIMDKLDLHSVAELTKYAVRAGLTSLED